jgi:hypothetical protein
MLVRFPAWTRNILTKNFRKRLGIQLEFYFLGTGGDMPRNIPIYSRGWQWAKLYFQDPIRLPGLRRKNFAISYKHFSISFTGVNNVAFTIKWLGVDQKLSLGQVTLIRTTFYEPTTAPSNLGSKFFLSWAKQLLYENANWPAPTT